MVTAVVAACAVVVACGLLLLWLQRIRSGVRAKARPRSCASSTATSRRCRRASHAPSTRSPPRARSAPSSRLTLDFDQLVDQLVAETAARTGADAVVLRVEGPGGRPVVASLGERSRCRSCSTGRSARRAIGASRPLRSTGRTARPPSRRTFASSLRSSRLSHRLRGRPGSSLRMRYRPAPSDPSTPPLSASSSETPASALTNARRFADVEARVNVDPATGVRNRRGYELELGREVARAERSGRPLSVIVVEVEGARARPRRTRAAVAEAGTSRHARDETKRHLVPARRARARGPPSRHGGVRCDRPHEAPTRGGQAGASVRRVDRRGRPRRAPAGRDVRGARHAHRPDVRPFGRDRLDARRRQERVHRGVRRPSAARSSSGSDLVRPADDGRAPARHARDARARARGRTRTSAARSRSSRSSCDGPRRQCRSDTGERRRTPF